MNTESKFEFEVGDLVRCAFFGDEVFELFRNNGSGYPLRIIKGDDILVFKSDGRYYVTHSSPILTLVSRPKKKESVTWYRVCYHLKENKKPYCTNNPFRSAEEFLEFEHAKKEDFHFIHLEPVVTHEYEVEL